MTTSIPPSLHEEMDALDAIERALVQLTTADLERCEKRPAAASLPPAPPLPAVVKSWWC